MDADYSYYLGPKWKEELKAYKKPVPTVVGNHSAAIDIFYGLSSDLVPSYLSKDDILRSTIGKVSQLNMNIHVKRGGSE